MERIDITAARAAIGQGVPTDDTREARRQFKTELEHVAAAYRHELLDESIRVYWLALKDIPVEIRTAGLTRCLQAQRFFPTVAEILNGCADVVDERRKVAARTAQALREMCDCIEGWRETKDGVVERCNCHARALALMEQCERPIKRPALPPSSEEVA